MIEIYHVPKTRSIRVIWTCEELELPYRTIPVDFSAAYRASAEWRRLNPVGKVPVLRDGDLVMFESGAMVQYLLDRYGKGRLQPQLGTAEHARYLQWSWFAEATFARPLGEVFNHLRAFSPPKQDVLAEMKARARVCCEALNGALGGSDYLVGKDFTAADIMTGYSLLLADELVPFGDLPNLDAYWRRLTDRPGFAVARS